MSLCVHCSVKYSYCFTFAPPCALTLALDFCKAIDRPWKYFYSGNRCLYTRSVITFTSTPLSILHSTRTLLASQLSVRECLRFACVLVCGHNFGNLCSFISFGHKVFVFVTVVLVTNSTYCLSSTVSMFAFRSVLVLHVVDVLLRCLAFSSDIHKPMQCPMKLQ